MRLSKGKEDLPNKQAGLSWTETSAWAGNCSSSSTSYIRELRGRWLLFCLSVMCTPFGAVLCRVLCWWHTLSSNLKGWAGPAWEARKANSIMGAKQMKWYEWNSTTHRCSFPVSSSFLKFHFIEWNKANVYCLYQSLISNRCAWIFRTRHSKYSSTTHNVCMSQSRRLMCGCCLPLWKRLATRNQIGFNVVSAICAFCSVNITDYWICTIWSI